MIALVDYGIGNLRSVEKALRAVGAEVRLTSNPGVILSAAKVVLPGVGAFGDGMAGLKVRGLIEVLKTILDLRVPLLGVCVGMQLLFEESDELGHHPGLGFLPGKVRRFPDNDLKVPQTGWNQIRPLQDNPLVHGLNSGVYAYFNHSYYCDAQDASHVIADTDYGIRYPSIVWHGRLYGVQFHPEKSQRVGLHILRNFVERC